MSKKSYGKASFQVLCEGERVLDQITTSKDTVQLHQRNKAVVGVPTIMLGYAVQLVKGRLFAYNSNMAGTWNVCSGGPYAEVCSAVGKG